ncbi:MAG: hypothetical protein ABIF40_02405 [archaeon]
MPNREKFVDGFKLAHKILTTYRSHNCDTIDSLDLESYGSDIEEYQKNGIKGNLGFVTYTLIYPSQLLHAVKLKSYKIFREFVE